MKETLHKLVKSRKIKITTFLSRSGLLATPARTSCSSGMSSIGGRYRHGLDHRTAVTRLRMSQ